MAPSMARRFASSGNTLQFFVCFICFLLFYVLDVVSITVYDRDTLLNIGSSVAQCKPDFEFLNAGGLFTDTPSETFDWVVQSRKTPPTPKKREESWRSRQTETPCFPTLLSQQFCWLTFSHWITNSVNCGRASHTNEKQGTAVLFASQKPGCLQWFQTQPSSSRASACTARTEWKSSQGKAEAGVFVSTSTTHGVMKGTYTLLNPSAPLIWNFIRFCVDHSGYRGNLQRS